MKIGIVIAMEKEAFPLINLLGAYNKDSVWGNSIYTFSNYPNTIIAICGVGCIQAAMATTLLIEKYNVNRIINYGFAGYFDEDLKVGDIVNVSAVIDCDMDLTISGNKPGQYDDFESEYFNLDTAFFEKITDITKILSSSDRFLDDGNERNKLIETFGKNLSDMEGIGVAVVCQKSNIPCSMVKCVSNTLKHNYDEYYSFSLNGIENCAHLIFKCIKATLQED